MKCSPCTAGCQPLIRREILDLLGQVPGWTLTGGRLSRSFAFSDAPAGFAFIATIAGFAASEGHFPDICLKEGRFVEVSFYTYLAGGLTLNDFIMAAKMNASGYE